MQYLFLSVPSTLLLGASLSTNNMNEGETDARVREVLSMEPEDFKTVFDLHEFGLTKCQSNYYKLQVFWDEVANYTKEDCETDVDDTRQNTANQWAKAAPIRNFHQEINKLFP